MTEAQVLALKGFLQCIRLGGHHWDSAPVATCVRCGAKQGGPSLLKLALEAVTRKKR